MYIIIFWAYPIQKNTEKAILGYWSEDPTIGEIPEIEKKKRLDDGTFFSCQSSQLLISTTSILSDRWIATERTGFKPFQQQELTVHQEKSTKNIIYPLVY